MAKEAGASERAGEAGRGQSVDVALKFPAGDGEVDGSKSKSFAGDLTQDVPTQRWVLINQAIEYLGLEGMNYMGGPTDDEENRPFQASLREIFKTDQAEARRTATAGAALGFSFWDIIKYWPFIQDLMTKLEQLKTAVAGNVTSFPESPVGFPLYGRPRFPTISIRTG